MSGKNLSKGDRLVSEVNEKSGELFLVQGKAQARNMWQKSELLTIAGLKSPLPALKVTRSKSS